MSQPRRKPSRFPKLVAFRAPEMISDAVMQAAELRPTSASEYARQAVLTALRADGFALPPAKSA